MMKILNILPQVSILVAKLFLELEACLNNGKMKEKYENNEITKEALEDWKANYPNSLKKDYLPFEESNVKFYRSGIGAKVPPDIK
ncbi:hypothetical protein [Dialister invisus]